MGGKMESGTMSIAKVCVRTKLPYQRVLQAAKAGMFPAEKAGRGYRVSEADVLKHAEILRSKGPLGCDLSDGGGSQRVMKAARRGKHPEDVANEILSAAQDKVRTIVFDDLMGEVAKAHKRGDTALAVELMKRYCDLADDNPETAASGSSADESEE